MRNIETVGIRLRGNRRMRIRYSIFNIKSSLRSNRNIRLRKIIYNRKKNIYKVKLLRNQRKRKLDVSLPQNLLTKEIIHLIYTEEDMNEIKGYMKLSISCIGTNDKLI